MSLEATTVRGVRLKYASEDAMRLADDLSRASLFECAETVRAVALVCLEELEKEGVEGAALHPFFSVRV